MTANIRFVKRARPDVAGQDRNSLWSSGLPIDAHATLHLSQIIPQELFLSSASVYLVECSVERARAAQ